MFTIHISKRILFSGFDVFWILLDQLKLRLNLTCKTGEGMIRIVLILTAGKMITR